MPKVELYTRYPLSSVAIYAAVTALHFVLGALGIVLGYNYSWPAYALGALYLVFAVAQMVVIMPLTVCPNCVYYRTEDSLCVSGMNTLSRKLAKEGSPDDFPGRAKGFLCHNNLYLGALAVPIVAMIPALVINFSFTLLAIFLAVVGLMLFRFFVIFGKIACAHCLAKFDCPNAEATGVRDL